MNNDLEYLKDKFNQADLQIPKQLDDRVMQKYNSSVKKVPFIRKRVFKTAVSLAACFAVFVVCLSAFQLSNDKTVDKMNKSDSAVIQTFKDADELKAYMKTLNRQKFRFFDLEKSADLAVKEESSVSNVNSTASYAETYRQVDGVDEADTIKTNGKYIFRTNQYYEETEEYVKDFSGITVFEADKGKAKAVSRIGFENKMYFEEEDDDSVTDYVNNAISDFYVTEDRLIVNMTVYAEDSTTKSIVYDISDIKNPKQLYSFEQRGFYTSSRMIGDMLYTVSCYSFDAGDNYKACLPYYCENNEKAVTAEPKDIAYSACKDDSFTVVSAIDTENGKRIGKIKSVIGAGAEVYCSTENLYIIGSDYSKGGTESTFVSKISFNDGIQFGASCKIKGYYDSQYSFHEKGNTFFACVTEENHKDHKDYNYIYAFDKDLKQIGKTKAFGKDESVKAVKYIDNYAYVITYEEIDPLFVIDVSDPKDMQIKGSVKISGFSTMLVPVGEDKLIGIGNATSENADAGMEAIDGVKLALFDISNPEKPKVLDSKEYLGKDSEAQYNPKALIVNTDKDYMAIPMDDYDSQKSGAILFYIKGDKIVEKDSFYYSFGDDSDYGGTRITFIDDYVYSLDSSENIHSHFVK